MDKAKDVHDHVIRTLLPRHNGYEVTTEGDAFLLAFHEASDAVAWSLATQQVYASLWTSTFLPYCKSCTPLSTTICKLFGIEGILSMPGTHRHCSQMHSIPYWLQCSHLIVAS